MTDLVVPSQLTNYNRTRAEVEALVVYAVMAWGRESGRAVRAMQDLLDHCPLRPRPFLQLRSAIGQGTLRDAVESTRIGDYAKRTRALERVVQHDPRTVDVDTLSGCIGKKSARLVILHSRADADCAVLDRHVLRYLRQCGYPVSESDTPSSPRRYREVEVYALEECRKQGRHPAELDLTTWMERSVVGRA